MTRERVQAPEPVMEAEERQAVWEPVVSARAARVETRVPAAGTVALGRIPVARVWTVARAPVVPPGWLVRARAVKAVRQVKRVRQAKGAKEVEREPPVHRASTAPYRCRFGSIGSMSKVARQR